MGSAESKRQWKKVVTSDVIGSHHLANLWNFFTTDETLPKSQLKSYLKTALKQLKYKATSNEIASWIEDCRSVQGKYPTDAINFIHFKRIFLYILTKTTVTLPLSEELQTLLPTCTENVFGVSVEKATLRSDPLAVLPKFIEETCNYLNQPHMISTEGLYRIPGSEKRIHELIQLIDLGEPLVLSNATEGCGLLIKFCKYVSDGLYAHLTDNFWTLTKEIPPKEREAEFSRLCKQLPSANRELLSILAYHYALVLQNSEHNKMTRQTLGTCVTFFGPGVLSLLINSANNPEVLTSTVKYGVSFKTAADRSKALFPTPISSLTSFLNLNANFDNCHHLYPACSTPYESKVREVIYLLHNDVSLNRHLSIEDTIPASLALLRFLFSATDSLFGDYEEELSANVENWAAFNRTFEKLSIVYSRSISALGSHIKILSQLTGLGIEECCRYFPMHNIPLIMPVVVQFGDTVLPPRPRSTSLSPFVEEDWLPSLNI